MPLFSADNCEFQSGGIAGGDLDEHTRKERTSSFTCSCGGREHGVERGCRDVDMNRWTIIDACSAAVVAAVALMPMS